MNNKLRSTLIIMAILAMALSACSGGLPWDKKPTPTPEASTENTTDTNSTTTSYDHQCFGVPDGSIVIYGAKTELVASKAYSFTGPGVLEWWDGIAVGADHEGMWYLKDGETIKLPIGTRGSYWPILASGDMSAGESVIFLENSHLHLYNFASKPQHTYAATALKKAMDECNWVDLTQLMVHLPNTDRSSVPDGYVTVSQTTTIIVKPCDNGSYAVVDGDTLIDIGVKLGVNWQKLANRNGLNEPYTIYIGQNLCLP